jgi:hypothetical protein
MALRRQSSARPDRLNGQPVPDNPTGPYEPPPQEYGAFASPGEGYPVNNPLGWAPQYVRPGDSAGVRADMRPDPSHPAGEWARRDADEARRHSVEFQDADGWTEQKGYKRWAPNPRSVPVPEDRPTMQMAPTTYQFTRPFDQFNRVYGDTIVGSKRELNGTHFSMADHRRDYPILGMAPPNRVRRNTFRLTPAPWDTDLVDLPPATQSPYERVRSVEVPQNNRSYRL